jgi:TPR repeat protein
LAWLGGLRPALAAGCWLRANLAWEQHDEAATVLWIELTVAADGRPDYFWINGARMMAYDLPTWLAAPDPQHRERWAQRALAFLDAALPGAGDRATLMVEMANIHLRVRRDLPSAAVWYRRAAEQPGAPHYAARIHGELLVALGRTDEALRWLREVRARLPADDPRAQVAVVDARIRALKARVGH